MKFRKKPVVIEAIQYRGDNGAEVDKWMQDRGSEPIPIPDWRKPLEIKTLEGTHFATAGDWIICGIKGEFYPCKPDIFHATYELAEPMVSRSLPDSQL